MAQTEHFSVTGFRPVCLTVDKIGPFQDKIHTFDFTDKKNDPPEAIIENAGNQHRLDQLSRGEKSLLQMCLRTAAHMTKNSILLIDEMDVHLHSKWQHRLLNWLKDMARTYPGLTIIATTHSREVMNSFAFDIEEEGVKKGGHFFSESRLLGIMDF